MAASSQSSSFKLSLRKSWSKRKNSSTKRHYDKKPAILTLGGSFCPCHTQHCELLASIKEYMESVHNFDVIAAYLVISTDRYVFAKLRSNAISFSNRKKICDLTIEEHHYSDWMYSSHIECVSAPTYGRLMLTTANRNNTMYNSQIEKSKQLIAKEKEEIKLHKDLQSRSYSHLHQKRFDKLKQSELNQIYRINCCGADKLEYIRLWRHASLDNDNGKCIWVAIGREGFTENIVESINYDIRNGNVSDPNSIVVKKNSKHSKSEANINIDTKLQNASNVANENGNSNNININNIGDEIESKNDEKSDESLNKNDNISFIFLENECESVSSTDIRNCMNELNISLMKANNDNSSEEKSVVNKQINEAKVKFRNETNGKLANSAIDYICSVFEDINQANSFYVDNNDSISKRNKQNSKKSCNSVVTKAAAKTQPKRRNKDQTQSSKSSSSNDTSHCVIT